MWRRPLDMDVLKNEGILFIAKLLALFCLFYFGTLAWAGLCAGGGAIHLPFVDEYLNYISWTRSVILLGANQLAHLMGLNSFTRLPYQLRLVNGPAVSMVYSCIGFGVMSAWAAFVLASRGAPAVKLGWLAGGLLVILCMNCWRVALLLYFLQSKVNINQFGEHHNLYNNFTYAFVLLMMWAFVRLNRRASATLSQRASVTLSPRN